MKDTKLLIIVPCYNEEEVLEETTRQLSEILNRLLQASEISVGHLLYVDDGSKDRTWKLIKQFSESHPEVHGLKLAHNVGHQQALWAGLKWAATNQYSASVSIDADLQDDQEAILDMVHLYNQGVDIVYGVRKERHTDTAFKKYTALGFYRFMKYLGCDIVYNHADFRLMSLRTMKALTHHPERNLFIRGLVRNLGFPSASVYYDRKERFAGESKYPLSKMLNFALDGITSFSIKPLRIITFLGLTIMLISFATILYALFEYIGERVMPGWTSLLISLWFIGGAILTSLGIIGEYIGKIYKEVKQRPYYFIEEEAIPTTSTHQTNS